MLTRVKDYNIFAKLGSSDFIDSGLCVAAAIVFPGARLTAEAMLASGIPKAFECTETYSC